MKLLGSKPLAGSSLNSAVDRNRFMLDELSCEGGTFGDAAFIMAPPFPSFFDTSALVFHTSHSLVFAFVNEEPHKLAPDIPFKVS